MVFFAPLLLSVLFVVCVTVMARTRSGMGRACWFSGLTAVTLGVFIIFPVVALQALLTFFACVVCLCFRFSVKTLAVSSVVLMFASYGFALFMSMRELHKLAELRESYPLESMTDRLAYETESSPAGSKLLPLSDDVEKQLVAFEQRLDSNTRRYMLESLHSRTQNQFVLARGFGNFRMGSVRKEQIELPDAEPIRLPEPPDADDEYDPHSVDDRPPSVAEKNTEKNAVESSPSENQLQSIHRSGLNEFLDGERMGYVKDRAHVAGFQPHGFFKEPDSFSQIRNVQQWQMTRLELVSLLKFAEPSVYASRDLPQMDQLDDAPRRPLDAFERAALNRLRHEEDLMIDDEINRVRMLGALRAGKDCLECHRVARGTLLGAFSYELHRIRPVRSEKKRKPAAGPRA